MYFNKKNKFLHGVMFHHFHDRDKFIQSQGSISSDQFVKIIKYIGRKNIINADEFSNNFLNKKNIEKKVCFTFDDALKCQEKIALPILEDYKIKAFFFIYSGIFEYDSHNIEIVRHFRHLFYKNINEFYKEFIELVNNKFGNKKFLNFINLNKEKIIKYQKKFPIYSKSDVEFRFIRDYLLNANEYKNILSELYKIKNFKPKKYHKSLLMNKESLRKLKKLNHEIGLHSHSHPTKIINLNYQEQYKEYNKNLSILSKILKTKNSIKSMSHPCGVYDKNTLKVLKKIDISIGFKESMLIDNNMKKINNSRFEIARIDHSNIINSLK